MSLKKQLEAKNAGILDQSTSDRVDSNAGTRRVGHHTAPGALLGFTSEMRDAEIREKELKEKLKTYEGALPVLRLEPDAIHLSRWANRHELNFTDKEFASFRAEIKLSGGNVQPVKVRPLADGDGKYKYELVYGQRRLRACKDEGVLVNALVEELTDQELFLAMERENKGREDLSPYELGMHYQRALDTKLWPSQNALAFGVGVTQAYVSQVLVIATLPKEVIAAFPSVLEIQVRWGKELARAIKSSKDTVLLEAKKIATSDKSFSSKQVFDKLIGRPEPIEKDIRQLKIGGEVRAIRTAGSSEVTVRLLKGTVTEGLIRALDDCVVDSLKGKGG